MRIKVSFAERVITISALDFLGISVNKFSVLFHVENRKLLQTNAAFNFLLMFVILFVCFFVSNKKMQGLLFVVEMFP